VSLYWLYIVLTWKHYLLLAHHRYVINIRASTRDNIINMYYYLNNYYNNIFIKRWRQSVYICWICTYIIYTHRYYKHNTTTPCPRTSSSSSCLRIINYSDWRMIILGKSGYNIFTSCIMRFKTMVLTSSHFTTFSPSSSARGTSKGAISRARCRTWRPGATVTTILVFTRRQTGSNRSSSRRRRQRWLRLRWRWWRHRHRRRRWPRWPRRFPRRCRHRTFRTALMSAA